MRRTLRAGAAGMAAAAVWVAVEPVLRRSLGGPHRELRLVGRMLAPERAWLPVGLAVHLSNGALFGIAFDRLGGRGVRSAVIAAQVENALLWPAMALVDRLHPDVRSGAWPPLARNPRVIAQELAGHAVFGAVLGGLLPDRPARG
ncbi:MAG: hypothetical protein QOG02_81 [Gaiellales bacterium]|nr:hypothetical protein [Gaiellales bacterium]MDX6544307.1 hypothetical protein [Gaiellales bacterium]